MDHYNDPTTTAPRTKARPLSSLSSLTLVGYSDPSPCDPSSPSRASIDSVGSGSTSYSDQRGGHQAIEMGKADRAEVELPLRKQEAHAWPKVKDLIRSMERKADVACTKSTFNRPWLGTRVVNVATMLPLASDFSTRTPPLPSPIETRSLSVAEMSRRFESPNTETPRSAPSPIIAASELATTSSSIRRLSAAFERAANDDDEAVVAEVGEKGSASLQFTTGGGSGGGVAMERCNRRVSSGTDLHEKMDEVSTEVTEEVGASMVVQLKSDAAESIPGPESPAAVTESDGSEDDDEDDDEPLFQHLVMVQPPRHSSPTYRDSTSSSSPRMDPIPEEEAHVTMGADDELGRMQDGVGWDARMANVEMHVREAGKAVDMLEKELAGLLAGLNVEADAWAERIDGFKCVAGMDVEAIKTALGVVIGAVDFLEREFAMEDSAVELGDSVETATVDVERVMAKRVDSGHEAYKMSRVSSVGPTGAEADPNRSQLNW
ncbi:hypothetical protein HK101_002020 [Irineochytrium annulatum]|nr:hypothetical protein HK101_002020 [Irineochytrium annulatum]